MKFPKYSWPVIVGLCSFLGGILWQIYYPIPKHGLSNPTVFSIPKKYQGHLRLFVLAGQSNMSGRGKLKTQSAWHPHAFVFGNDYHWHIATEPIDSPLNQVDRVSVDDSPSAQFGPSLAFALSLIEKNPDLPIGLIPCAKSDTTLAEWERSLDENTLYGSCLKRVRAASTMGQVAGILIFQGESDAKEPLRYAYQKPSANDYALKFSAFMKDWRNDLVQPSLPVVFAQIGTTTDSYAFVNWEIVKKQQAMIQLPCTKMITTTDLALGDFVHFNTASYETIGQRFAQAYLDLLTEQPNCNE